VYDFIVGAGSAGGVVAARLSGDPSTRVLVPEGGPADDLPEIAMPAAAPTLWGGPLTWDGGGRAAAAAAAGPARAAPLPLLRRRGDPDAARRARAGCRPRPGRVGGPTAGGARGRVPGQHHPAPGRQRLAETAARDRPAGVVMGAALANVAPASGAVVAIVGGRDFARSQLNLATGQGGGFPPGSSIKVFYLVAALEKGIPPSTSFDTASPVTVTAPACPTGYTVHYAEPASGGRLDLARATAQSINTYAQLMARVGTPAAIAVARRMGITSPLRDWCSLVLGTENLTAGAGRGLCHPGQRRDPLPAGAHHPAHRPDRPGPVRLPAGLPPGPGPAGAATEVGILRGVVGPGGTGFRAACRQDGHHQQRRRRLVHRLHARAGHLGVGRRPRAQVPMRHQFGGGPVYGGTFPARIFHDHMAAAVRGLTPRRGSAQSPGGPVPHNVY
jgi:hypothetical protein